MKYSISAITDQVMEKAVDVQFKISASCSDYEFFARMSENVRKSEVENALSQMPEEMIETISKVYGIKIDSVKPRND